VKAKPLKMSESTIVGLIFIGVTFILWLYLVIKFDKVWPLWLRLAISAAEILLLYIFGGVKHD